MSTTTDYLQALVVGDAADLPVPKNNIDFYLAKMCGTYDGPLPDAESAVDQYLKYLAENGSSGGGEGESITYEDMSYFFQNGARLSQFDEINKELFPYAKKMSYLFNEAGISGSSYPKKINTGNCEDLSFLLSGIKNGYIYNVPEIDTSKCKNMKGLFYGCTFMPNTVLNTDISDVPLYDTSLVEDISYAFYACRNLFMKTGKLPDFDLSNVLNAEYMLYGCSSLITVPSLNTAKCKNMRYMFNSDRSLTTVESIDMTSCETAEYMFYCCSKLSNINLLNTQNVKDWERAFREASALVDISCIDTSGAIYCYDMFWLTAITDISHLKFPQATQMQGCFGKTNIEVVSNLELPLATNASYLFNKCPKLKSINGLYAPKATNLDYIFQECPELTEILNVNFSGHASSNNILYFTTGCSKLARFTFSADSTRVPLKFKIDNCNFDSEGMIEFFESLPEGGRSTIGISGNPCVTDGTLTEENIAIATAKGYTITT